MHLKGTIMNECMFNRNELINDNVVRLNWYGTVLEHTDLPYMMMPGTQG